MIEQNIDLTLKAYAITKIFFELISKLPKSIRYSLGLKIENSLLDLITQICLALRLPKNSKELQLIKIGSQLDLLILMTRLLNELGHLELKKYLGICDELNQIQKMIGGWLAYARNKN